jgi:hypothetical protein
LIVNVNTDFNLTPTDAIVKQLEESLSVFSPELVPVHERLVTIRRQLATLSAKEGTQKAELKPLQEELRKIDLLSVPSSYPPRLSILTHTDASRLLLLLLFHGFF